MTATYDPTTAQDESLDTMMNTGKSAGLKHYFGKITVLDVWDCVLERGRGKVPFDPNAHAAERRNVAVTLKLTCTKQDGSTYDLDQSDLAGGNKFAVTLQSLKSLGVKSRSELVALAGRYAQAVRKPTGRTYVAQKGARAGEIIAEDALEFLALYDNVESCQAAERAFYTPKAGQVVGDGRNVPQAIVAEPVDDQARAILLKSIPMLWTAAQQNPVTFAVMLAANNQYAQFGLTPTSPEVLAVTGRDASEQF